MCYIKLHCFLNHLDIWWVIQFWQNHILQICTNWILAWDNEKVRKIKVSQKIAVLLASYNGIKYIKEQIDSILNQKNVNVTIFISDDL